MLICKLFGRVVFRDTERLFQSVNSVALRLGGDVDELKFDEWLQVWLHEM